MEGESEPDAWQRLLRGDEQAFGVLWDLNRDRVFRHLLAMGNSSWDAEDLTATVFLELWRRRRSVRLVDGSPLPWLIVTAQNVTRNAARARRRHRRFLASLPAPGDTVDHAEWIAARDDQRIIRMRAAIAGLGATDAALLAMTALEGFTVREAAGVLNLSDSAAKMRLSRLRARLRVSIAPYPIEPGGS